MNQKLIKGSRRRGKRDVFHGAASWTSSVINLVNTSKSNVMLTSNTNSNASCRFSRRRRRPRYASRDRPHGNNPRRPRCDMVRSRCWIRTLFASQMRSIPRSGISIILRSFADHISQRLSDLRCCYRHKMFWSRRELFDYHWRPHARSCAGVRRGCTYQ